MRDTQPDEVEYLKAVIAHLRARLAEAEAAREKTAADAQTIRYVSEFHIGQMMKLGLLEHGEEVIYAQALLNDFDQLLRACASPDSSYSQQQIAGYLTKARAAGWEP